MNYSDILEECKKNLPVERQWWPDYFYHFTDIHNIIGIIESGWIYGRAQANERKLMLNDNASRIVIDMTDDNKKTYGRLYFRPLTPTQYHNEGYKPESIRQSEINASCPVPVFLMLSVERTMSLENVKFAEKGIAGNHDNICQGMEAFEALNFKKIYHDGPYNAQTDGDIKEFKHSEIIREGGFPLRQLIRGIVCRSNAERETLLYFLRKRSGIAYEAYKNRILYAPLKRMFYNNGIFIKEVDVIDWELHFELNSRASRSRRNEVEVPFDISIFVTYMSSKREQISTAARKAQMNYCTVENIVMKLEEDLNCTNIIVKVMFDDVVMYENEISLLEDSIL